MQSSSVPANSSSRRRKLGAAVGFQLLWFIILGCFIKVFVQIELGRFAIADGMTTLQAMNSIRAHRLRVSWGWSGCRS